MKKILLSVALLFSSFLIQAQVMSVVTSLNDTGDIASFELDCTKKFPSLAKGLRYNVTRHEFKGAELKNDYRILLIMNGFYPSVKNKEVTVAAEFSDGTIISEIKALEEGGYFNGTCTLKLKSPPDFALNAELKKVTVHAEKDIVYIISEEKSKELKKNLANIINVK